MLTVEEKGLRQAQSGDVLFMITIVLPYDLLGYYLKYNHSLMFYDIRL